ncbi:MAG: hypothetical protein ACM3ZE_08290 [Myxococcales bacterium]
MCISHTCNAPNPGGSPGMTRMARLLAARRLPWLAALAGGVLCITAVGDHMALDDYWLGLATRHVPVFPWLVRREFDLFTFTTGRPEDNLGLMAHGVLLPWWTQPDLKIAFFRPIASATHHLDFALWPDAPRAMYVHSLIWLGAAILAVASLFRRVEGASASAGLATLLYATDDARAPLVAWISNRNALIATTFGALAIATHARARNGGNTWLTFVAAGLLLLGLLSGEIALGAAAYLGAHALLVDTAPTRTRLQSLAPHLVVLLLWSLFYSWHGFGARGSGAYLDPIADPLRFAVHLPGRLLILLQGQFGIFPSDLAFFGSSRYLPVLLAGAVLTVAVVAYLAMPLLRTDPLARFWTLGTLGAALPVACSFSSDRLLSMVGIGGAALSARIIVLAWSVASPRIWELRRLVTTGFALVHIVLAPVAAPFRAAQIRVLSHALDVASGGLDDIVAIENKTVLILNAPAAIFVTYLQAQRAFRRRPLPAQVYLLSTADTPLEVEAEGPCDFLVRPLRGFLHSSMDRHYRAQLRGLEPGTRIDLPALQVEIVRSTRDGRPAEARLRLDASRMSQYQLITWKEGRFATIGPLKPGEKLALPALDLGRILLQSALGAS